MHGKREGKWKIYDPDEKIFFDVNYKNGHSDLDEMVQKRSIEKYKWTEENQDIFMQPGDYLDVPALKELYKNL